MEVIIRPFRTDDWDGVFFLDRACFEPPYRLEYPRLRALVQDRTVAVIVAEARQTAESAALPVVQRKEPSPTVARSETGPIAPEPTPAGFPEPVGDGSMPSPDPAGSGDAESAVVAALLVKHDSAAQRLVVLCVMVDPSFRRFGLGRRLMGWAERMARGQGFSELLAPLESGNADGAALLAGLGFTRHPGAPPFFDDPAGGDLWLREVSAMPSSESTVRSDSAQGPAETALPAQESPNCEDVP
jgi:GNAT superfamily N-acetyltransferase